MRGRGARGYLLNKSCTIIDTGGTGKITACDFFLFWRFWPVRPRWV